MITKTGGIVLAALLLVGCAGVYSDDPATRSVQRWTDVCAVYGEVLEGVADGFELGYLTTESAVYQGFVPVRRVLRPICTSSAPPAEPIPGSIQDDLDRILLELIKARQEAENG